MSEQSERDERIAKYVSSIVVDKYADLTLSDYIAGRKRLLRQGVRDTAIRVDLDLAALLDRFGWSRQYAEHLVQPYCSCDAQPDGGWDLCEHARDLGISPRGPSPSTAEASPSTSADAESDRRDQH